MFCFLSCQPLLLGVWWWCPRGDRPSGQVAVTTVAAVAAPAPELVCEPAALPQGMGRARVSQVQDLGMGGGCILQLPRLFRLARPLTWRAAASCAQTHGVRTSLCARSASVPTVFTSKAKPNLVSP